MKYIKPLDTEIGKKLIKGFSIKNALSLPGHDGDTSSGLLCFNNKPVAKVAEDAWDYGTLHTKIIDNAKYKDFLAIVEKIPPVVIGKEKIPVTSDLLILEMTQKELVN